MNHTKVLLCENLASGFCTHLVSFTNASSYHYPTLECPRSCFKRFIIEVNRQQGFLINSSTLQTKDFKESGTCHPKDIKGCSYAYSFSFDLNLTKGW